MALKRLHFPEGVAVGSFADADGAVTSSFLPWHLSCRKAPPLIG